MQFADIGVSWQAGNLVEVLHVACEEAQQASATSLALLAAHVCPLLVLALCEHLASGFAARMLLPCCDRVHSFTSCPWQLCCNGCNCGLEAGADHVL